MKREIFIDKKYILIPIKIKEKTATVSFICEQEKKYEFEIPVANEEETYKADYYAPLKAEEYLGKMLTIEGDVPELFLKAITTADNKSVKKHNQSKIHFSPVSGWINDPNGLIYQNGNYHLFFQHNPFDVKWGNMSWGHAVSKDLLYWTQLDDVMYPDENGTVFSGCAIENERELLNLPKYTQLYFYTVAGNTSKWSKDKKFVQKISYSTDGGKTLQKVEGNILDHIAGENRDPKVYWYEEKQVYYMVLYLDKNDYAIFNSHDLKTWNMTQKLTFPEAWECPDFRRIEVEGGGSKWMFWTADGYYYLGEFDGSRFETDGKRREAYLSKLPYAAQTYYGTDRVIIIPWLRTQNDGQIYCGTMGIPRQLSLIEKNGTYILRQKLVDEYENRKHLAARVENKKELYFSSLEEKVREVVVRAGADVEVQFSLYGTKCLLKEGMLQIDDQTWRLNEEYEKVSFLLDGEILEVTIDDGLGCLAYEMKRADFSGEIQIHSDQCIEMEIYEI